MKKFLKVGDLFLAGECNVDNDNLKGVGIAEGVALPKDDAPKRKQCTAIEEVRDDIDQVDSDDSFNDYTADDGDDTALLRKDPNDTDKRNAIQRVETEKAEQAETNMKDGAVLHRTNTMQSEIGQEVELQDPSRVLRSQRTNSTVDSDTKSRKANNMARQMSRTRSEKSSAHTIGSDTSGKTSSSSSSGVTEMASNTKYSIASRSIPQNDEIGVKEVNSHKAQPGRRPKGRAFFKISRPKQDRTSRSGKFSPQSRQRSPKLDTRMTYIASRRMNPRQSKSTPATTTTKVSSNQKSSPLLEQRNDAPYTERESSPYTANLPGNELDSIDEESYDSQTCTSSQLDETFTEESVAATEGFACDGCYDGERLLADGCYDGERLLADGCYDGEGLLADGSYDGEGLLVPESTGTSSQVTSMDCDTSTVMTDESARRNMIFWVVSSDPNDIRNMAEKAADVADGALNFCCANNARNSSDDVATNDLVQSSDEQTDVQADRSSGESKGAETNLATLLAEKFSIGPCGPSQGIIVDDSNDNLPLKRKGDGVGVNPGSRLQNPPVKSPKRFSLRLPSSNLTSKAFMRIRSRIHHSKNSENDHTDGNIPNEDDIMADILNEIKLEQEKQNTRTKRILLPKVIEEEETDVSRDEEQLQLLQNFSDLIASAIAEEAAMSKKLR